MADNVIIDVMANGSTVATDNIGDVQYQRVKLTIGNDGTAVGDVYDGRPLPVSVINGTTAITGGVSVSTPGTITSGSIAVTAGTIGTVAAVGQVHNAGTVQELLNGTVRVTAGTVQATLASPGTITSGSIAITAGTIGTVASVAQVHNAGTIAGGTVGVLQNLTNGSIVVTGGTILSGTINNSGTTTGVGTISNLAVVHNAGTIQNGTLAAVTTVANLTNGTVRVTAGTINSGTINAGTINAGTIKINPRPSTNLLTIGSVHGTNAALAGTLVAAPGASTILGINELSIVNEGTSNVTVGMGFGTATQGTTVIVRAALAGNGGIQKSFPKAIGGSHVNLPLVMWTTGSGTASFTVTYWSEAQ